MSGGYLVASFEVHGFTYPAMIESAQLTAEAFMPGVPHEVHVDRVEPSTLDGSGWAGTASIWTKPGKASPDAPW